MKNGRDTKANDLGKLARRGADRDVGVEVGRRSGRDLRERPRDDGEPTVARDAESELADVVGRDEEGRLLAGDEAKGRKASRARAAGLDAGRTYLPRVDDGEAEAMVIGREGEDARLSTGRAKGGHTGWESRPSSRREVRPDERGEVGGARPADLVGSELERQGERLPDDTERHGLDDLAKEAHRAGVGELFGQVERHPGHRRLDAGSRPSTELLFTDPA